MFARGEGPRRVDGWYEIQCPEWGELEKGCTSMELHPSLIFFPTFQTGSSIATFEYAQIFQNASPPYINKQIYRVSHELRSLLRESVPYVIGIV